MHANLGIPPRLVWRITALLLAGLTGASHAQTHGQKERFTAFAVNMSNIGTGATATVEIAVDRWSTESERQRLAAALKQGPDELLRTLQKTKPVGTIRTPDSIGYDLHYAHQIPGEDGGRRIIIATDRPIGFWEARNRPRTIDYPFTLIEMHIRPDGTGEGKMSIATKITARGNVVELENYASEAVRLQQIRSRVGDR